MIIFDGILKEVSLSEIVGGTGVKILRDYYIYRLSWPDIGNKWGLTEGTLNQIKLDVARFVVYTLRKHNYFLTSMLVTLDEEHIKTCVWNEYLREEIEGGKTTGEIAISLGVEVKELNKYM